MYDNKQGKYGAGNREIYDEQGKFMTGNREIYDKYGKNRTGNREIYNGKKSYNIIVIRNTRKKMETKKKLAK